MAHKIQTFESAITICKDAKTYRSKEAPNYVTVKTKRLCGRDLKHYYLSTGQLKLLALSPARPLPHFHHVLNVTTCVTLKMWEWPGDEAKKHLYTAILVQHS